MLSARVRWCRVNVSGVTILDLWFQLTYDLHFNSTCVLSCRLHSLILCPELPPDYPDDVFYYVHSCRLCTIRSASTRSVHGCFDYGENTKFGSLCRVSSERRASSVPETTRNSFNSNSFLAPSLINVIWSISALL